MLKKSTNYVNFISILLLVYLAFISLKPNDTKLETIVDGNFYIENAYEHVKNISKNPHFASSENHKRTKSYIIKQLQKLGLEVKVQKTMVANKRNTFIEVENIFVKIKGKKRNRKSLVLLSHYDSALFASQGAADAGSGVAVILEGLRAFKRKKIQPENDIIILITDAEEIGLLGAKAFVNKHRWTQNIGLVLNFEARGTAGASIMLMETNGGNHAMLNAFKQANLDYPTSNSLAYSIYKSLPNDTDLSVFRKDKNIQGYNFAFIDNHFNYHTQLDNIDNLSLDSLAHQAHYLTALLKQFSQQDLSELTSDKDDVYFQIPYWKTLSYPFSWSLTLSLINLMLFVVLVFLAIKNKTINKNKLISASYPLLKSMLIGAIFCFMFLKFEYWLHPYYNEILQGFTYNGFWYVIFVSVAIIFLTLFFYKKYSQTHSQSELLIPPILLWIIISILFCFRLTGAHFFVLISFAGTLILFINTVLKKTFPSLNILILAPILLIFSSTFIQLPVALGLMSLPFSSLLLVLFISIFIGSIQVPNSYHISPWLMLVVLVSIYSYTQYLAPFNQDRPIPDSLFYYQDEQTKQAYFYSLDNKADDWNKKYLEESQLSNNDLSTFKTKHVSYAKMAAKTEYKGIKSAQVKVLKDRKYQDMHIYYLKITPQRVISYFNITSNNNIDLLSLKVNGEQAIQRKNNTIKKGRRIAKIYRNNELDFKIEIAIKPQQNLDVNLIEVSPDLLTNKFFDIPPRPDYLIPKPFFNTDSIITKKRINLSQ